MLPTLHRQRGAVAIMVALTLLILLAVVGLVIDGGLAYMVKARLNAAVDSAAVAAARAVTAGNNQTEQTASAQAAAVQFFTANIPDGYLLSKPALLSTTVTFNAGMVTIDVRAEAPMPVSVMQVLGFTSMNPVAYAQTIRKDLDMAFVVDTSGSLTSSATTVRTAAKSFLNKFNVTQDRVGLIHFASGSVLDNAIATSARGFNRTAMLKNIDNYSFIGGTASMEGMWRAREQLNLITPINRSSLRVIVFFSDGDPSAFGSYVTFTTASDCQDKAGVLEMGSTHGLSSLDGTAFDSLRDDCRVVRNNKIASRSLPTWYNAHNIWPNVNDVTQREFLVVTNTPRVVTSDLTTEAMIQKNVERASRNLVEAVAAKAQDEGIFVFTLGLGSSLKEPGTYDTDTGETILKCMANVADGPSRCYRPSKPVGMYCYAATEADLTPCFSRLASAILRISR